MVIKYGKRAGKTPTNHYKHLEIHENHGKCIDQRTIGPENAHLKPDPAVLCHHEMTLTLNTHTPLLNS